MALVPGLSAAAVLTVGEGDLAPALRSGDVPVLATPRLIALCEEATVAAVAPALAAGETTVGARVEFDHLAATPCGARVTAAAVLAEVEGRRLCFTVTATADAGVVGRGRIIRVVVDRAGFAERSPA